MKIPKQVTILGQRVSVRVGDVSEVKEMQGRQEDLLGLAWVLEDKIWLNNESPRASLGKVLTHEIFHIVLYKIGASQNITPELEEVLCQTFSQIYYELKKQGI